MPDGDFLPRNIDRSPYKKHQAVLGALTAELSGFRIMSGACLGRAERVMRNQLERFVAAARISKQATISAESCFMFILYFRNSGNKVIKR